MKKIFILIGVALLVIPSFAMAAYFMTDNTVPKGEVIIGNLYLVGDSPNMAGDVQGDLYAAGGNVAITGNVSNDVGVAGGTVSVTGEIGDDIRIFGGSIFIDGKVNGEVLAFGGDVKIGPNANIRKDVVVGGGKVNIDSNARIFGTTQLYTDAEGKGKFKKAIDRIPEGAIQTGIIIAILLTVLTYMVVAAVMMGVFPGVTKKYLANATSKDAFWKSLGLGLLTFIVTPIIVVLCFVTGIGLMLGFVILLIYLMYFLLNIALAGVLFGSIAQKLFTKIKKVELNWAWGLGGVVVLHLITLLPVLGWIVGALFFLYSFGAVLTTDWKMYRAVK